MFRIISLVIFYMCINSLILHGQEIIPFEGKLYYRSMENHDKKMIKWSSNMTYNGARNTSFLVKGNKVLFNDESIHVSILLDSDKNEITLFFDLIGKGMLFDYDTYAKGYLGSFSKDGPSYKGINVPPTVYRFESVDENILYLDIQAEYVKGRIETSSAGTTFDIYRILKYKMPETMYSVQLYGIDLNGLIAKFVYEQVNDVPLLGKFKSFVCSELLKIEERIVADSEFIIPDDIKIEKSESPFKVLRLYKENVKFLKRNNMYPTQMNKDIIYKIDDESWDF